jgi:transcriptional regulator with GAF, ATPase, and Fis domain
VKGPSGGSIATPTSPPSEHEVSTAPTGLERAQEFAGIARGLVAEADLDGTLVKVCTLAVAHMAGAEHAGVTLVESKHALAAHGATDEVPEQLDRLQFETDQGPCLDAIRQHEIVQVADLRTESRWPGFAPAAVERIGVRSLVSFRLFVQADTIGALTVSSMHPGAFEAPGLSVELGSIFASHAAVALSGRRALERLQAALATRETISMAMGLLMGRQGIGREEAFDVLRRASQRMNVKLRDIAEQVAGGAVHLETLLPELRSPTDP